MAAVSGFAGKPSVAARAPAIAAALTRMNRAQDSASPGQGAAPPGDVPVPAPVHVVGLDTLAAGADVRQAPIALWSYLLHGGGGEPPAALADVDAKTLQLAAITEGDAVRSIGTNIRAAQSESGNADYDLSVIRVPALYLSAVWMKGRNGAADIIIPGDSPKSPLLAGKHYSADEFTAALKEVAERELQQTQPLSGG